MHSHMSWGKKSLMLVSNRHLDLNGRTAGLGSLKILLQSPFADGTFALDMSFSKNNNKATFFLKRWEARYTFF